MNFDYSQFKLCQYAIELLMNNKIFITLLALICIFSNLFLAKTFICSTTVESLSSKKMTNRCINVSFFVQQHFNGLDLYSPYYAVVRVLLLRRIYQDLFQRDTLILLLFCWCLIICLCIFMYRCSTCSMLIHTYLFSSKCNCNQPETLKWKILCLGIDR